MDENGANGLPRLGQATECVCLLGGNIEYAVCECAICRGEWLRRRKSTGLKLTSVYARWSELLHQVLFNGGAPGRLVWRATTPRLQPVCTYTS